MKVFSLQAIKLEVMKIFSYKSIRFNPVPTRLCHVIYYYGDNEYHCLVRIELMQDWVFRLDTYHNILPIGKRRLSFLDSA